MVSFTPQDWVKRLSRALDERQGRYALLSSYASGEHPLPQAADPRWKSRADAFARRARTNYCGLASSSVRERLTPVGFRSGSQGTNDIDQLAWGWWQASHLDADSELVHSAALDLGEAYVIVGMVGGKLTITPEDPRNVIVELDPLDRRTPIAGLKRWIDPVENKLRAILYLPDSIHYFQRTRNVWGRSTRPSRCSKSRASTRTPRRRTYRALRQPPRSPGRRAGRVRGRDRRARASTISASTSSRSPRRRPSVSDTSRAYRPRTRTATR